MALPVIERIHGLHYTVETLGRRDYADTAHDIIVTEHADGRIEVSGTRIRRKHGDVRKVWSWILPERTDRVRVSTVFDNLTKEPRKLIEAQSAYITPGE